MAAKSFSQDELNRVLSSRLSRERSKLEKEFEKRMKRCMASVHLTLYEEMCALKRDMAAEIKEVIPLDFTEKRPNLSHSPVKCSDVKGGEDQ
jgi:hypothetical protein